MTSSVVGEDLKYVDMYEGKESVVDWVAGDRVDSRTVFVGVLMRG